MKLIVKLCLASLLFIVLFLAACAPKEKEVLRLGTGAEYPPFNYLQGEQFMGIDIDISRRIAEKLGMDIAITQYDFNSMFAALASNKIDLAASAISITQERKKTMDFTVPYYMANQVLIAKKDSPIQITKLEDVGKHVVGTLNNTTGHIYLDEHLLDRDLMPRENLKLFSTNIDAINDLLAGKLDLVMIDDSAALGYAKQIPIIIAYTIQTKEAYGLGLQKGKAINEKINEALQEMLANGEVKSIIDKHMK